MQNIYLYQDVLYSKKIYVNSEHVESLLWLIVRNRLSSQILSMFCQNPPFIFVYIHPCYYSVTHLSSVEYICPCYCSVRDPPFHLLNISIVVTVLSDSHPSSVEYICQCYPSSVEYICRCYCSVRHPPFICWIYLSMLLFCQTPIIYWIYVSMLQFCQTFICWIYMSMLLFCQTPTLHLLTISVHVTVLSDTHTSSVDYICPCYCSIRHPRFICWLYLSMLQFYQTFICWLYLSMLQFCQTFICWLYLSMLQFCQTFICWLYLSMLMFCQTPTLHLLTISVHATVLSDLHLLTISVHVTVLSDTHPSSVDYICPCYCSVRHPPFICWLYLSMLQFCQTQLYLYMTYK